jgi:hypothetical protein
MFRPNIRLKGKNKIMPVKLKDLGCLINQAISLAKNYRSLTGRPLGITGEVAEYEAVRLLKLELAPVRQSGYDAIRKSDETKIQIKGRCVITKNPGQRLGKIQLDKEWDYVVLVLLDQDFEPTEIYQADRKSLVDALTKPGSKARNERGALSITKFKSIGKLLWSKA